MYIYIISNGTGQVKVGITNDPKRRLQALQTGNAKDLKLHLLVEGDRGIESRVHRLLTPFKSKHKGEWFDIYDPKDISWLCRYIVGVSMTNYDKEIQPSMS